MNKKNTLALVLAMAFTHSVLAADFAVDSEIDDIDSNPGDGICATADGACTLRAAVQEANAVAGPDTIALPAGTYSLIYGASEENAAMEGDLDILQSLTITGAGNDTTVIDGMTNDRIFHIMGGDDENISVYLSGLTLQNGRTASYGNGGAIRASDASLELTGVVVAGNTADGDGGGVYTIGDLSATDSTFEGNTTDYQGGGIYSEGKLLLHNVTVSGNNANHGGGIYLSAVQLARVTDSTITGNRAYSGGGIKVTAGETGSGIILNSTSIESNTASSYGGGLYAAAGTNVHLIASSVQGNSADNHGGGAYFNAPTTVSLVNTNLSGNSASMAGGAYVDYDYSSDTSMTIIGSTFDANSANYSSARGGALFFNSSALNATIANSAFLGNSSLSDSSYGSTEGGAIYNDGATVDIVNTTFSGNSADIGGALLAYEGTVTLKNDTFAENTATEAGANLSVSSYAQLKAQNTIIALPITSPNCDGNVSTLNYNIVSDDSCGFTGSADQSGIDPLLATFDASTHAYPLSETSPALNSGYNAACPDVDQLFGHRSDGSCDIGATESNSATIAAGTLQFTSASYDGTEADGSVTATLSRSGDSQGGVSVTLVTGNGTAQGSSGSYDDFLHTSQTVTWADGDTADKQVTITLNDDSYAEDAETFELVLLAPTGGAELGTIDTAVVNIINDDDWNYGSFSLESAYASIDEWEGSVTLTVSRWGGYDGAVSVEVGTSDGTAHAAGDYETYTATLSWPDGGSESQSITIPIMDDDIDEGDEKFYVSLANPAGGADLGFTNQTTVTIGDDDVTPTVGFASSTGSENEEELWWENNAFLAAVDRNVSDGELTVEYRTVAGTAVGGEDYQSASGTLTFADGSSREYVEVPIVDDDDYEGDETFTIVLSSPVGGELGDVTVYTATIIDDDELPTDGTGTDTDNDGSDDNGTDGSSDSDTDSEDNAEDDPTGGAGAASPLVLGLFAMLAAGLRRRRRLSAP